MLGSIIFKLRAENSAAISSVNGRFMHAAFFNFLREFGIDEEVHDRMNIKPFTVSFLKPFNSHIGDKNWQVSRRDHFLRRVTTLNEEMLRVAASMPIDFRLRAGELILNVDDFDVSCKPKSEFLDAAKHYPYFDTIKFDFVSPTTFRIDDCDAPYPRPELIFQSIAEKWTQLDMPATVDKKLIRELTVQVRLTTWQGRSRKVFLGNDRGTLAFSGNFCYNLERLNEETRRVFGLPAKFAEYSGVGRLTAQGFGQTRVDFA